MVVEVDNSPTGDGNAESESSAISEDRVIWRPDLQSKLNVTSNTIRRWINSEKLPPPDVSISHRTKGWRMSTLIQAGIRIF